MDFENIDIIDCLKGNPWEVMVKVVTAYMNWSVQNDTICPYHNIRIFRDGGFTVIKSIEDLSEEYRKYIFEELDIAFFENSPVSHELLLECNEKDKVQALALLFVSYYSNITNKFVKIFHYVFNMGIHNSPAPICLNNRFHFQMQILCTLCDEGRLEDIRIFVEYCGIIGDPLVKLLGVEAPDIFTSDLQELMAQTYRIKRGGLETFPLVYAIRNKHFHVVEFLLKKNDSVYNIDSHGKTSLHHAFNMDDISIILLLLNYVANESDNLNPHDRLINTLDSKGNTVLDYWLSNPMRLENHDQVENITSNLIHYGALCKGDLHIMNEIGELIITSDEERADEEYLDETGLIAIVRDSDGELFSDVDNGYSDDDAHADQYAF